MTANVFLTGSPLGCSNYSLPKYWPDNLQLSEFPTEIRRTDTWSCHNARLVLGASERSAETGADRRVRITGPFTGYNLAIHRPTAVKNHGVAELICLNEKQIHGRVAW